MSKCDLTIELDEPERRYRCGEVVTGRVRVRTDGEVTCKKLVIEQLWRTHGRGNTDEGSFAEHVETDQRWFVGQVYEVPFQFTVPPAPVSHHGHLVNVDHYVTARADLPWKIDPRAHADYLVAAGPGTPERYVETEADFEKAAQVPAQGTVNKGRSVVGTLLRILFAPVLIALVIVLVAMLLALLLVLLPILLVVFLVRFVRQSSAERKLGPVLVHIDAPNLEKMREERASPGALARSFAGAKRRLGRLGGATYLVSVGRPVPVTVRFTPKNEVLLDRVVLSVTATESATSGSGTNSTTHSHVLVEEKHELSGPLRVSAGHSMDLRGEILLPADSAASFRSSDNRVTWAAKVAIEIPQWPDWVQSNDLLVVPSPEG